MAVPEPCSRPTESFLECLNDIVVSWTRQENSVEIADPLGCFLHASLERIIVSSPIGYNDSSKTVFESLLDQFLRESMDIYLPFLKALYIRDVTNFYRLLAFCCARSKGKTVEITLGPYIVFINVIGGNVAQNILKDLNLSQQIDDAGAQACALLDKTMADGTAEDELDASGRSATAEQSMMAAARKVLSCVSPRETPETMSGLLKCLVHFCTDGSMLHNVLNLPDAYDDFSFAILTRWMHKVPDVVTNHFRSALEGARSEFFMDKTVAEVLRKLDRLQDGRTRSVIARDAETKVLPLLQDEVSSPG
ncbi:hypothetical protein PsorP6_003098 [Peronosclerospora sorghi]|uniref:Uncharacterized protein n=1 Tax=Peronosclerospora sorghi TaxID=230839 RepID=A0ACC0VMP1_9STRA|nr:hypothetical protein PsorP6_003098 [Peronosclerospora sorghi]